MRLNPYRKATHALRWLLLHRLPACEEMVSLMSQSMERPLGLRERVLLKLHLWVCVWCVWYLEQLRLMRETLRARAVRVSAGESFEISLDAEARERIKSALSREPS
ncbi:MAG TPA: hypothetical protein VFA21_03895 [Pyrinomonadaceae bacterium]|jgi:hypothetical protein|nr:hypothetical protein [Pyrinomonadaceae bacterium]